MDEFRPSPHLGARLDQDNAALNELLAVARQHLTGCCAHPHVCGANDIYATARTQAMPARLIGAAIMRLALSENTTTIREAS